MTSNSLLLVWPAHETLSSPRVFQLGPFQYCRVQRNDVSTEHRMRVSKDSIGPFHRQSSSRIPGRWPLLGSTPPHLRNLGIAINGYVRASCQSLPEAKANPWTDLPSAENFQTVGRSKPGFDPLLDRHDRRIGPVHGGVACRVGSWMGSAGRERGRVAPGFELRTLTWQATRKRRAMPSHLGGRIDFIQTRLTD